METISAHLLLGQPAPPWAEQHMRGQYAEIERLRVAMNAALSELAQTDFHSEDRAGNAQSILARALVEQVTDAMSDG